MYKNWSIGNGSVENLIDEKLSSALICLSCDYVVTERELGYYSLVYYIYRGDNFPLSD